MAVTMKGRTSIRRVGPESVGDPLPPRRPRSRTINPWLFDDQVKRSPTFTKLEQSYVSILAGVDGVEDRRACARGRSWHRSPSHGILGAPACSSSAICPAKSWPFVLTGANRQSPSLAKYLEARAAEPFK
jgi:hypothetical protein